MDVVVDSAAGVKLAASNCDSYSADLSVDESCDYLHPQETVGLKSD